MKNQEIVKINFSKYVTFLIELIKNDREDNYNKEILLIGINNLINKIETLENIFEFTSFIPADIIKNNKFDGLYIYYDDLLSHELNYKIEFTNILIKGNN
jgi:hypothetical protein